MTQATTRGHRDHGGNLDAAMARYGGGRVDWLDLSTGINPEPYPLPALSHDCWAALPRRADMARLTAAARAVYDTEAEVVATNGAQGAIQALPWLRAPGHAAVLAPTYNEHAAALRMAGWQVSEVATLDETAGADLAVVVNPNNPDGRRSAPERLLDLSRRVGMLVVDESFADPEPALSLAPLVGGAPDTIVVLRSFGKFYGLAGLRLGFALARGELAERLARQAGPWPVSGPAIEIAIRAFEDRRWQSETCAALSEGAARLDALASAAGLRTVGGTTLFRTYAAPDAAAVQDSLARARIWTRIFPYSRGWIRLGLPPAAGWTQLEAAFAGLTLPLSAQAPEGPPRPDAPRGDRPAHRG